MSFGGSQGTVRYAILLQDQVSVPAQKISNEFRNMGTSMTTLTQKANVFNNSIMSNTRAFTASVTPIKNTGNALNQLSVQQKTIGSQLASIGSGFKNNALAIGAAASSVLGLYQNYANLSSAQNAANKSATAAKAAQNNLTKAQDGLNKAIDKYGAGSKEAKDAQNKLTVAQERAVNKTESAKIAQDNLNQTMADFGINILPNVVLAGGSIVSIFDNIGGKATGLTGAFTKMKGGLESLSSSLGTSKAGFLGMAGAIGAAAIAAADLFDLLQKGAEVKALNDIITAGKATETQLEQQIKNIAEMKKRWDIQIFDFFKSGPIGKAALGDTFAHVGDEVIKSLESQISRIAAAKPLEKVLLEITNSNIPPSAKTGIQNQIKHILAILDNPTNWKNPDFTKTSQGIVNDLITTLGSSIKSVDVTAGLTGALRTMFTKTFKGVEFGNSPITQMFAADPKPIAKTGDEIGKLAVKVQNFGATATNASIQEDKLKKTMLADQATTSATTATYVGLVKQLQATYDTRGKSMTQLQGFAAQQENINKQIEGFQQDQEVGYKDVEASILGVAFAHNVNTEKMVDMVRNGVDEVAQLRTMVAEAINYTAALDDMKTNQELVSEGFLGGITSAESFFNDLVKGTVQQNVFNASLAEGAYSIGINSEMLAFSSSKMQDLIKTTYEMSQAVSDLSIAAATDTSFLKDNVLIQAVLKDAMIKGAQAANDWTINMISSVQQAKDMHGQTVQLAADMLGLPVPIGASTEELQKLMKTFQETGDAGRALAQMMTDKLAPSFERMSGLIQSKDMKELRDNLKKMELPKGFNKDIDDAFKPLRSAAENARKVGNAMDILVTAGANMSKKDLTGNMKAFGNELDRMSKIKGTSTPVDAVLKSLKTMSPEQLGQHTESMQFLVDTINKFGKLPKDKAKEFLDMYNSEVPKIGPSSDTAARGVNTLADSLLRVAEANFDPSKFIADPKNTKKKGVFKSTDPSLFNSGQDTKITADNSQALKAIDVVAKRIASLTGIKAIISLVNNAAIKATDVVAKRIDSLTGIKPQISLQNKQAIKSVDVVAKRIDSLEKIKPSISLSNTKAFKVVDSVAKRIMSLEKLSPTVTVHVKTVGQATLKAQHGLHATLQQDTLIQAHKGERVDIGGGGGETRPSSSSIRGGGGGSGSNGNITVNNIIDLGGKEIIRSFKKKLGQEVYTMGR